MGGLAGEEEEEEGEEEEGEEEGCQRGKWNDRDRHVSGGAG